MLKIVYVVAPPIDFDLTKMIAKNSYVIGVDSAVDSLIEQGIKIDLAVGDFDSISSLEILKNIKNDQLNKEKDETDTEVALSKAYQLNPDYVYLIGGINGLRVEHFYANTYLLNKFPNLEIKNDQTRIKMLEKGEHVLAFKGYISLFGYPEAKITLEGFKYPLNEHILRFGDVMGISNELNLSRGKIIVDEGRVITFMTKKA